MPENILYFNDGQGHVRQVPANKVNKFKQHFPGATQADEKQLSEIETQRATQSEQEGRTTIGVPQVPQVDTSAISGGVSLPESAPVTEVAKDVMDVHRYDPDISFRSKYGAYKDDPSLFRDKEDDAQGALLTQQASDYFKQATKSTMPMAHVPEKKRRDEEMASIQDFLVNTPQGRGQVESEKQRKQYFKDLDTTLTREIGKLEKEIDLSREAEKKNAGTGLINEINYKPSDDLLLATKNLRELKNLHSAVKDKDRGAVGQFFREFGRRITDSLPAIATFGATELIDSIDPKKGGEMAGKSASLLDQYAQLHQDDRTIAQDIANGTAGSLEFMAQFAATGGIVGGATKGIGKLLLSQGAKKAAEVTAKKGAGKILQIAGREVSEAMMQTAIMPSTTAMALEMNAENPGSFLDNFTKAYLSNLVEVGSEKAGAFIPGPKFNLPQSVQRLQKATGIDGMVGEFLEEQIATAGHSALNDQQAQWSDFTDMRQQLVTAGVVGLMQLPYASISAGGYAAGKFRNAQQKRSINKAYTNNLSTMQSALGDQAQPTISWLNGALDQASQTDEGVSKLMVSLANQNEFDEQQTGAILNYGLSYLAKKGLETAKQEQMQQAQVEAQETIQSSVNPETNSIILAKVPGMENPVQIQGEIALNPDGSVDTHVSKEVFYTDAQGKRQVIDPRYIDIIENVPAEEALQELTALKTAEVVNSHANDEVRTYEPGEVVRFSGDGNIAILGQIQGTNEDGNYMIVVDGAPAPVSIEPRMIINEDNLQGVDNGVLVDYEDQAGNIITAEVEDMSLRGNGIIIINGEEVQTERVIGVHTEGNQQQAGIKTTSADPVNAGLQSVEIAQNESETGETVTESQNAPVYPLDKKGEPDFDNFTPEHFFAYTSETEGPEVAIRDLQDEVTKIEKKVAANEKKISTSSLKEKVKLRNDIRKMTEEAQAYRDLIDSVQPTQAAAPAVDVQEVPAPQEPVMRQEPVVQPVPEKAEVEAEVEEETAPSITIDGEVLDDNIKSLISSLNIGRKKKDIFDEVKVMGYRTAKGLFHIVVVKNKNGDSLFNIVDAYGEIPQGMSADFKSAGLNRILDDLGEEITGDSKQETVSGQNQKPVQKPIESDIEKHKRKQFNIIQASNPMQDDIHTGIRSVSEILTAREAFSENIARKESATPDFSANDMKSALRSGKIKVYSSNQIKNGTFITPSQMEAQNYAGEGRVYSKIVPISNIAWISTTEGQYAEVPEEDIAPVEQPQIEVEENISDDEKLVRKIDAQKEDRRIQVNNMKRAEREAWWGDIQTLRELIMRRIINGQRIIWEDTEGGRGLGNELGFLNSKAEKKARFNYLAGPGKGITPESLAEIIYEENGAFQDQFIEMNLFGMDDNDIRSEVIDVLNSYTSKGQMIAAINEERLSQEFEELDMAANIAISDALRIDPNEESQNEMLRMLDYKIEADEVSEYEIIEYYENQVTKDEFDEYFYNFTTKYDEYDESGTSGINYQNAEQGSESSDGERRDQGSDSVEESAGKRDQDDEGETEEDADAPGPVGYGQADQEGTGENAGGFITERKENAGKTNQQLLAEAERAFRDKEQEFTRLQDRYYRIKKQAEKDESYGMAGQMDLSGNVSGSDNLFASDLSEVNQSIRKIISDAKRMADEAGEEVNRAAKAVERLNDQRINEKIGQKEIFGEDISSEIESQKPNINPTEGQKEAGNYKKAHINVAGFDITIENPKGSERSGTDPSGRKWTRTLKSHYGYFKRTNGKDGDQIDVFIGENPESRFIFVVDQNNQDGTFDEHKVMLGYDSFDRAKEAYLENYEEGWQGLGAITVVELEDFRKWIDSDSKRIKPFSEYKQIQEAIHETEENQENRPKRFEQGSKLTDNEKRDVLKTMKDSYKEMNRERSLEAVPDGNEMFVWKGSAEDYMVVSDITGRKVRWYVTMPDGKIAHPTELYPNMTNEDIISAENSDNYHLQQSEVNYRNGAKKLAESKRSVVDQLQKALDAGLEFVKTYDSSDVRERNPITMIRTNVRTKENPNGMIVPLQEYMANNDINIPDLKNFDWERYYNDNKNEQGPGQELKSDDPIDLLKHAQEVVRKAGKDATSAKTFSFTDKGVNDYPQQAQINGNTITVTNKSGRKIIGKFTIALAEWEATNKGPSANDKYNKRELVKQKHIEAFPGNVNNGILTDIAERVIDSQVSAINNVYQQMVDERVARAFAEKDRKDKEEKTGTQVMTEEEYLALNGAPFMGGSEPALHKNIKEDINKEKNISRVMQKMSDNNKRREELRKEYAEKLANGEVRPPTRTERLIIAANGHEDNEGTHAARRLLEKDKQKGEKESQMDITSPTDDKTERLEDFGEKIGGARKDQDVTRRARDIDSLPAWRRKYSFINADGTMVLGRPVDTSKPFAVGFFKTDKTAIGKINRFTVIRDEGDWRKTKIFSSEQEAEDYIPIYEVKRQRFSVRKKSEDEFVISKISSTGKLMEFDRFPTKEEAEVFINSTEGATSLLNRKREDFSIPALEKVERTGKDYRKGKNITTEEFMNTFGFRGGEFGNWVKTEERQVMLNMAYDSFMDLADILGIDPRAVSLNGELGIAFGARGVSSAVAHYEPLRAVINLTRMNGAGSLAHEWAHAMDNYFGIQANKKTYEKNEDGKIKAGRLMKSEMTVFDSGMRDELRKIYDTIAKETQRKNAAQDEAVERLNREYDKFLKPVKREADAIVKKFEDGVRRYLYNRKEKKHEEVIVKATPEQVEQVRILASKIANGEGATPKWDYIPGSKAKVSYISPELLEIEKIHKAVFGKTGITRDSSGFYNLGYYAAKFYEAKNKVNKADNGEEAIVKVDTDFMKDSEFFDSLRAKPYWATKVEMFARAFEYFVQTNLEKRGVKSDYLQYDKSPVYEDLYERSPYPKGEERIRLNELFQELFDTIQQKVNEETGNVMLYEPAEKFAVNEKRSNIVKNKANEKANTRTVQMQINWEAENGDVPARRAESIATDTGISDVQRKAGYDATIDNRITHVERILTNQGAINFMGSPLTGPAQIRGANDVAFLFKNLESAASENMFIVLANKDDDYRVLYQTTGISYASLTDLKMIAPAAQDFGATRVWMVHNHPTGTLEPSPEDVNVHRKLDELSEAIGIEAMPSIIINLGSGKYVEFYDNYPAIKDRPAKSVQDNDRPIDIYSFDTQKLYVPSGSKTKIKSSKDIATFLSQQKRGSIDKIHVMILDRSLNINRYFLVDGDVSAEDMVKIIMPEVGRHGESVIISSNGAVKGLKELQRTLSLSGGQLIDVLEIKQDQDIINNYRSYADIGLLEGKAEYSRAELPATINIDGVESYGIPIISNIGARDAFLDMVHQEQDALESVLFNWNDIELDYDQYYDEVAIRGNAGRDRGYSSLDGTAPYKASKKQFLQWLFSDKPFGKEYSVDQEWTDNINNLRDIASKRIRFENAQDIRFSMTDEAGFYSTVEDALEKITQDKGTPEQFKAMLLKNGAKQAEMDWMGWDDYFVGNRKDIDPNTTLSDVNIKGTITKADIQNWIDQNRIEVQEIEKSDNKTDLFDEDYKNAVYEHAKSQLENAGRLSLPDYQKVLNDWMDRPTNMLNLRIENILWRESLESYPGFRNNNGYSTKFAQYTLPGGKNYRELLLTMPSKGNVITPLEKEELETLSRRMNNEIDFPQKDIDRYNQLRDKGAKAFDNKDVFKSAHFDESNIVAHVRFDDRKVNGERVLFIEEIQSDWAQEGKKKGFKGDYKNKSSVEPRFDGKYWYLHEKGSGEMTSSQSFRTEAEAWKQIEGTMRLMDNGVPNMPFKKTDQWVNLALRRMMMYAAENGYDRIAWTTGQQQADRYDLSKQVDEIEVNEEKAGNLGRYMAVSTGGNSKAFVFFNPGGIITNTGGHTLFDNEKGKHLSDVVGKELAQKVIESDNGTSLKGVDLQIGGKGMIAFYDQIVPKAAKKLGKPFGAEVEPIQMRLNNVDVKPDSLPNEVQDLIDNYYTGEVEMDELSSELDKLGYEYDFGMDGEIENVYKKGGDSYSFQSIPITDELREIAPGGMPLFSQGEKMAQLDERLKAATGKESRADIVKSILDEIESSHNSPIEATVVKSKSELIGILRMMGANDYMVSEAEGSNSPIHGVYYKGMIIINAESIGSAKAVLKVWAHENFHAWMKSHPNLILPLKGVFSGKELNGNLAKGYHKLPEEKKIEEILAFAVGQVYTGDTITRDRTIRDLLDPIIKQYLDYVTEGKFSRSNPNFGRGAGGAEDALLDNQGSGRESTATSQQREVTDQQRQKNGVILPGNEGVPGTEGIIDHTKIPMPQQKEGQGVEEYAREVSQWFHERRRYTNDQPLFSISDVADAVGSKMPEDLRKEYDVKYNQFFTRFREAWEDTFLPVKDFLDVLRKNGMEIAEHNDIYKMGTHVSGKNDAQLGHFTEYYQKPISLAINKLEKSGFTYRDIENYVFSKHGIERNEYMRAKAVADLLARSESATDEEIEKINARDYAGITALEEELGKSVEEYIEKFEEKAGEEPIKGLWSAVNKATHYTIEKQYQTGMMSKDTYDELTARYKFYVPLRGHDAEVAEDRWDYSPDMGTFFTAPLIAAKGRRSRAESPFAYIAQMAHSAITQGNKNTLKQALLRLARKENGGMMSVSRSWNVNIGTKESPMWEMQSAPYDEDVDMYLDNQEAFEARMKELEGEGMAFQSGKKLNIGGMFIKPRQAEQHEIHVYQNGVNYTIFINANPAIARAINGANRKDIAKGMGFLTNVTRNMAANFTTRNPLFVMTNLSRDYIYATTMILAKETPKYEKEFQMNLPHSMGALRRYLSGKMDLSNENDKYMYEYLMNGAKTGFSHIFELNRVAKSLERESKKGDSKNWKDHGRAVLDVIDAFNEGAENITRLSVYMTSRKAGRSILQSVDDAKNITVNFNQKGAGSSAGKNGFEQFIFEAAGWVRPLFLFTNAAIQSLSNIVKVTSRHPGKMAGIVSSYALMGFVSPMLAALMGGDDGEDAYLKLTDWERQNNWCILLPNGSFLKIPLPHEMRIFHRLGDNIYQAMMGKQDILQTLMDTMFSISDLLPMNPMGATTASWAELSPDAIRPITQIVANKNFMGSQVYNKWANENMPGYLKARTNKKGEYYAPQFMVDWFSFIDDKTGGDGVKKGLISFNPDIVNHLLRGYFGGLYTLTEQALGMAQETYQFTQTGELDMKIRETPLRTFYADKNDLRLQSSGLTGKYYKVTDKINEARRLNKGYLEEVNKGEMSIEEYAGKVKDLDMMSVSAIYDRIKEIRRMESALIEMGPEEQREAEKAIFDMKKEVVELSN